MSSFFKRPSWATTGGENPDTDFYRRSQQTYADILAANRQRKVSQEETSACHTTDTRPETRKRRRVSADNDFSPCGSPSPKISDSKVDLKPTESTSPAGTRSNTEKENELTPSNGAEGLDLDDPAKATSDAASPASRGKAISDCAAPPKMRRGGSELSEPDLSPANWQPDINSPKSARQSSQGPDPSSDRSPVPLLEDPIVKILITSEIANTKPLVVLRKASQSLKDVRLAWCSRQNMSEEEKSSVLLTWKGRRLFDVTTCRSLGLDKLRGLLGSTDLLQDEERHQIQIEAVTEESFAAGTKCTSEESVSTEYDTSLDQSGSFIRVTLRCPGLEEHKVKVKPSTSISRLIASFRDTRSVSPEREVHLIFDGDRLDPASSLAAYDIADLDLIEVQLR